MSPAVPHIERLPCQYDEINLDDSEDIFVILPDKNITISNIYYKNKVRDSKKNGEKHKIKSRCCRL